MEIAKIRAEVVRHYLNQEGKPLVQVRFNSGTSIPLMKRDIEEFILVDEPFKVGDVVEYMDKGKAQIQYIAPCGKRGHIMGPGIDTWAMFDKCRRVDDYSSQD